MKTEFIPKVITLLAGAVVCIVTVIKDIDTTTALEYLLATLIIFFILGNIAKFIIEKVIAGNSVIKKNSDDLDEDAENTEDTNSNESDDDSESEEENKELE